MVSKKRKLSYICIGYFIIACLFYFIAGEEIKYKKNVITSVNSVNSTVEVSKELKICQEIFIKEQNIEKIVLDFNTFYRENSGIIDIKLLDKETGDILSQTQEDVSLFKEDLSYEWILNDIKEELKGKEVILQITSNSEVGEGIGILLGTSDNSAIKELHLNGKTVNEAVSCKIQESTDSLFGKYYFIWVVILMSVIVIYTIIANKREKKGKITVQLKIKSIWTRYRYLIYQLVTRDFKTKYKRSMLGYLWSFLNPLLSMLVQYVVFSTLFRSDIENFPVYLLSGIILFNFFSDAVGQGLGAIVQNASLITKVYVPKYIYPVTKVISCSVNLIISVLPLFIVMFLTGQNFTKAVFLLPFPLICLLIFCIGLSLLLCSAMVFFRDTQYLWGIISLAWTYATPIFYPAEIIPPQFAFIQKLNPMFHYIRFTRTLLLDGVSPSAIEYFYCLLFAIVALGLGCFVFKKTQDKFILYI